MLAFVSYKCKLFIDKFLQPDLSQVSPNTAISKTGLGSQAFLNLHTVRVPSYTDVIKRQTTAIKYESINIKI